MPRLHRDCGEAREEAEASPWVQDGTAQPDTLENSGEDTGAEGLPQVGLVVKNMPDKAGDVREAGSVPGSGRSAGGGHGNPLWYSCLENPMDGGAWWATVQGLTKC